MLFKTVCDLSKQTQNICITFVQRWRNVFDVGPTLYKCYTNVMCLLGWLLKNYLKLVEEKARYCEKKCEKRALSVQGGNMT